MALNCYIKLNRRYFIYSDYWQQALCCPQIRVLLGTDLIYYSYHVVISNQYLKVSVKLVNISLIAGLILLYFVNAALKVNIFNWEMLIHSGIRFFLGFLVLGVGYFYEHKLNLKIAIILVLGLLVVDDIMDYMRDVTRFSVEQLLHNLYMLLWGVLTGYAFMRDLKGKMDKPF